MKRAPIENIINFVIVVIIVILVAIALSGCGGGGGGSVAYAWDSVEEPVPTPDPGLDPGIVDLVNTDLGVVKDEVLNRLEFWLEDLHFEVLIVPNEDKVRTMVQNIYKLTPEETQGLQGWYFDKSKSVMLPRYTTVANVKYWFARAVADAYFEKDLPEWLKVRISEYAAEEEDE